MHVPFMRIRHTAQRSRRFNLLSAALCIVSCMAALLFVKQREERLLFAQWLSFPTPTGTSWMRVAFSPWQVWALGAQTSVGGPLLTSQTPPQIAQWYAQQLPGWQHKTADGLEILCTGNLFLEISNEAGGDVPSVTLDLIRRSWRLRNLWEEPPAEFTARYRCQ